MLTIAFCIGSKWFCDGSIGNDKHDVTRERQIYGIACLALAFHYTPKQSKQTVKKNTTNKRKRKTKQSASKTFTDTFGQRHSELKRIKKKIKINLYKYVIYINYLFHLVWFFVFIFFLNKLRKKIFEKFHVFTVAVTCCYCSML